MKKIVHALILGLIAAVFFWAGAASAEEELKELTIGIIPTESSSSAMKGFEPFRADMEKALGIPVKLFMAPDYAGVIEAMRFNKVQIAWFGNKSAIEAVNRADGEVFAQTVDISGNPGYWSLIVVHKDSPFNSIDDIIQNGKTLTFGNGDPNSTSGYLIPTYYIWGQNGIDPAKHFKLVRNANHETNLMAVANKQVDFATNNTENWDKFSKAHPEMIKNVRIVWKSPLIPSDPMVWRKDLPKEWKSKIKGFFLAYGRIGANKGKELAVLKGMSSGWAPFQDSSNHQLLPIMEINYAKDRMKIQNNDAIAAEAKATKVAEIDKQLGELQAYGKLIDKFN
ncbi:phosphonate ABC transporter substrate-binding protein [Desulfatitalea tepidiphila]|uniref:phosphonate ABC transporter substrate-binding protein n=1 Tax=Desulfatitalea tepidiphila TaxID=1185843 RepID=UPI0006B5C4C6|nr:phosphonate ABC transporter substrate-binding protein [Desulfatitalea tepidiphila]